MAVCTVESLSTFIRENSADCKITDKPNKRSDFYIECAINFAVQAVVKDKSDDFQETVQIKLKNGECIQSACGKCSGIVNIVGNVNGSCEDPLSPSKDNREANAFFSKHYGPLKCVEEGEDDDDYVIEEFEVLGDGGCQFSVKPKVPDTGEFLVNVLCVVLPDISDGNIPPQLCRQFYLVAAMALFWIYTYEADPAMANKAQVFLAAYRQFLAEDRDVNRDIFLESIVFGTRTTDND